MTLMEAMQARHSVRQYREEALRKEDAALLREEGVMALKDAKANHDKLEAVYNPYVDFDGVRALAAMETGRLLSYLG